MKKVLILLIATILAWIQPLSYTVQAIESAKEASDFRIVVDDRSTLEKTILHLTVTNEDVSKIDIDLPYGVNHVAEESAKQFNVDEDTQQLQWVKGNLENDLYPLVLTGKLPTTLDLSVRVWKAEEQSEPIKVTLTIPGDESMSEKEEDVPKDMEGVAEKSQEDSEDLVESTEDTMEAELSAEQPQKNQAVSETTTASQSTLKETSEPTVTMNETTTIPAENVELYITALEKEVLSGKTANYELEFKVTGSQTEIHDAKIVVNLPKHPDVPIQYPQLLNGVDDSLVIAGVTPQYDVEAGTLTYQFNTLASGQVYRTIIKATPELGMTPVSNSTSPLVLRADASLTATELENVKTTTALGVTVKSDATVDMSKVYKGAERIVNGEMTPVLGAPIPGDYLEWELRVNVPKLSAGQTFLEEGSIIFVTDTLPIGTSFDASIQNSGFDGVYDSTTRTVRWELNAPTLAEQSAATTSLFHATRTIKLRINSDTPEYSELLNRAEAVIDLHKGTSVSAEARTTSSTSRVVMGGSGVRPPQISGSIYYGTHYGAIDGKGTMQNFNNLGSVPVVTDDARLAFGVWAYLSNYGLYYSYNGGPWLEGGGSTSLNNQILSSGYKQYVTEYNIDPKLKLNSLSAYMPVSSWSTNSPKQYYSPTPPTFIQVKVNGVWRSEQAITFPPGSESRTLTISDLGLSANEHVEAFRYITRNAPGTMSYGIRPYFDVYEGSVGLATNTVTYNYELNDGTRVSMRPWEDNHPNGASSHGPRRVNIVDFIETQPTVRNYINFVDGTDEVLGTDSNVQRGNNRIQIGFENTSNSASNVIGPVELVASLPKGVELADVLNITYTGSATAPSYEVLGEIDGQLQVKFIFDVNRLLPGQWVSASFDVDVTRIAQSQLEMQVYGYTSNTDLQVPSNQGTAYTQSIRETDFNDLNNDANVTEVRVKSENRYAIVKNDDLQINKQVKGSFDSDFSLFGSTEPGGDITYRFNLTNTTGEVIEQFSFLDVLPAVGDLGITDNVPRDSRFNVTLGGPINFIGTKWEGQVEVLYSTSMNPKRDDLYATVDYPAGATPYPNPTGAEDPNWMTESEVTSWNEIHSFMLVMKDGIEWLEGQDVTFDVVAKAPDLPVDPSLLDSTVDVKERAAWNSFAVTTNGLLAVEPLRVGVVMEYDLVDPIVEKTINGQTDILQLLNRDELFTWEVDYSFGNYAYEWTSAVLSDQIHELLDILDVSVVDEAGNDVSSNGTLTIENNVVTFELNKQDGSFSYLNDQVYRLLIESRIKASATDEELLPFITGNGIPNRAVLEIDDVPTQSNEVAVKPPAKGSLAILKVDEATGVILSGAEFELRKCDSEGLNCEIVATGVTDAAGNLTFPDLHLGIYQLVETAAPDGYRLPTAPIEVQLTEPGQVVELTVENSETGWELPGTGGMGTMSFFAGGFILMLLAAGMLTKRRTKEE